MHFNDILTTLNTWHKNQSKLFFQINVHGELQFAQPGVPVKLSYIRGLQWSCVNICTLSVNEKQLY